MALGANMEPDDDVRVAHLVGVRFAARVCHHYEYYLARQEQYCSKMTTHLHHHDGCFQEYIKLDATYLTLLPDNVHIIMTGPGLCVGLTLYRVREEIGSAWQANRGLTSSKGLS